MINPQTAVREEPTPMRIVVVSLCIILCAVPLVQALAPRAIGFIPASSGLIFFITARIFNGAWPPLSRLYILLALGIGGLAALSALWSLDSGFALERSLKITGLLIGGCALFSVMRLGVNWPPFLYWACPLALLCAGLICISELYTNGLIHHTWRGTEISTNLSKLNRAVVSFTLLLLPALGLLALSARPKWQKRIIQLSFLIITAAIAIRTNSQSGHLIVATAALCWFVFPVFKYKAAQYALIIVVCTGILGGPWLVQFLYNAVAADIHTMPWLANAYAADRLEIWDYVARKALENPLYGFGVEATRHVEQFDTVMRFTPVDHVLHPHNAVIQVWIEFGFVGALGLCALTAFILRAIFNIEDYAAQRLCLSVFLASFIVACVSYGLWQSWWIGLFTLIAALCGHIARSKKAAL